LKKGDQDLASTASAKKDKGKVTPEETPQSEDANSWAKSGADFIGSIFKGS
jgi:hypothetical protein